MEHAASCKFLKRIRGNSGRRLLVRGSSNYASIETDQDDADRLVQHGLSDDRQMRAFSFFAAVFIVLAEVGNRASH